MNGTHLPSLGMGGFVLIEVLLKEGGIVPTISSYRQFLGREACVEKTKQNKTQSPWFAPVVMGEF